MNDPNYISLLKEADKEYQRRCEDDFELFFRGIWVPTENGKKLLSNIIADFQLEAFRDMAPSLVDLRNGVRPKKGRFWWERTKGAGKDSDLAICLLWLLAFPKRPLYLQVGAADGEQAAIIKRRMTDVLYFNPWLADRVEIQRGCVRNIPGQFVLLDVLCADVAGSHGETPDFLVCNELSHVTKWEFIENLLDNADKVPNGIVAIATNAGFKGTKAEVLRRNAEYHPSRWSMKLWLKPAPWISKENVEDAKRRNLPSRFNRLWYGKWASGKGDAISEDDIERCLMAHSGPMEKPEQGWIFVAGMDLGISHDHAALVILATNPELGRVRLAWMKAWEPAPGGQVDLIDVQETVTRMFHHYHIKSVGFDPTEARLMAQQLRRQGIPMKEMSFSSAKNLTLMAACLVQVLSGKPIDRIGKIDPKGAPYHKERLENTKEIRESIPDAVLEAYDDADGRLRRDFGKLNIVERAYGYKLEAVSDEYGHADVGIALSIALPAAVDLLAGRVGLQEGDVLADDGPEELTKEEEDEMPSELREIYDGLDEEEENSRRGGL